jgi:hypothetical protein
MEVAVRLLLATNALFELAVAARSVLVGLAATSLDATHLVLGANALALSVLSLLMLPATDPQWRRRGLQVFTVFHWSVTAAWIVVATGGSLNPALIAHGVFALAFTAALSRSAT